MLNGQFINVLPNKLSEIFILPLANVQMNANLQLGQLDSEIFEEAGRSKFMGLVKEAQNKVGVDELGFMS